MDIRIPNNEVRGSRANNGYLPLTEQRDDVRPPAGGDRRAGAPPMTPMASPIRPPDHRFQVGSSQMPQPPSAMAPGQGVVPVNPWGANGLPATAANVPDQAWSMPKPPVPGR